MFYHGIQVDEWLWPYSLRFYYPDRKTAPYTGRGIVKFQK